MSEYKITPAQAEKLRKALKSYNAKISRSKKKGIISDLLPQKETMKNLRDEITTKSDYDIALRRLNAFSRKDALDIIKVGNIVTSKYLKTQLEQEVRRVNKKRGERLEKVSKEDVMKRGVFRNLQANYYLPKQINWDKMSQKDFKEFAEMTHKQSLSKYERKMFERYKENYLNGLKNTYGAFANPLIDILENLSPEYFDKSLLYSAELSMTFYYNSKDKYAPASVMNRISRIWFKFMAENNEFDARLDFMVHNDSFWQDYWEVEGDEFDE